jgi:hypothetical protein
MSLGLKHCLKQEIKLRFSNCILINTIIKAINGTRKESPKGLSEHCLKHEIGPTMDQEKKPTKGINGLRPLNICLKLEIGPTIGQREKSQQRA